MIANVSSRVGPAVAVVDPDESPKVAALELELVLDHLVSLDHRHRELDAVAALAEVPKPKQPVTALTADAIRGEDAAGAAAGRRIDRAPAEIDQSHQRIEHPTSLSTPTLALTLTLDRSRPPALFPYFWNPMGARCTLARGRGRRTLEGGVLWGKERSMI